MSTGGLWLVIGVVIVTLVVVWLVHNWINHRQRVVDDAAKVSGAFDKAKAGVEDWFSKPKQ